MLVEHCYSCHGEKKERAGCGLTARRRAQGRRSGPAIVPGKADESLLIKAMRHQAELKMPPKGQAGRCGHRRLREVDRDGATRPAHRHTAAVAERDQLDGGPQVLVVPAAADAGACRRCRTPAGSKTPIDRFILAKLEAEKTDAGSARRQARTDSPGHLRPDRPAADAGGSRGVRRRTSRRTPSRKWSIACWPRRIMASAGAGTGSTWPAMPRIRPTPSRVKPNTNA